MRSPFGRRFVVKTCIFKETIWIIWSLFSQAQALVVLVWVSWPKMVLTCFDHYVYCIIHYLHYFLVSELRQNSGSLQNRNWQKRWTWKNPRFLAVRLGWCWLNGVKEGRKNGILTSAPICQWMSKALPNHLRIWLQFLLSTIQLVQLVNQSKPRSTSIHILGKTRQFRIICNHLQ